MHHADVAAAAVFPAADSPDSLRSDIRHGLAAAAEYLPAQGPIGVFIHHNTLHAFEDEPFEQAVVHAARVFGTEPFLPESVYRRECARGRIRLPDLEAVLDAELGDRAAEPLAGGRLTRRGLQLALLEHELRTEDDTSVRWTLTETVTLESAAETWHACVEAVSLVRPGWSADQPPVRLRELLLAVDPTVDTDALVHPWLIRFCAAFLDQGVAAWAMPGRDRGMLAVATELFADRSGPNEPWSAGLPAALSAIRDRDALDVIAAEFARLALPREHLGEYLLRTALALRGWAGMIHHLEERPDRAPVTAVPARLADFIALRMVCDRVAAESVADRFGRAGDLPGLWAECRDRHPQRRPPGFVARAYQLFQVIGFTGLGAADIRALEPDEVALLEEAIRDFDSVSRRRLFHLAYERRYRVEVLDALVLHGRQPAAARAGRPGAQVIFCIDERYESFRRHLEETDPGIETFGTAGFFAVPMYFRGIDDWHATPLCPIVVRPETTVVEVPEADAEAGYRLRRTLRRRFGQLAGGWGRGSRELIRGGLVTAVGGAVAAVPLVARVLFPRTTARLLRAADPAPRRLATRLELERQGDAVLPDGTRRGFSVPEMAAMVRRVLEDIGLLANFARLVAVVGHGSCSRNNPHESAYDCGACGGGRGGPNARACAEMANDPRVRRLLAAEGLVIPDDTRFIGGMQDTCADSVTFYDAARLPPSHRGDYDRLVETLATVCGLDAQERCRRFDTAPLDISPAEALRHVEGRAVDLAQPRPELGHATNALCVIGRRWRTRGLFLDRRGFLVSYDPEADADGTILTRILSAVGPVGAGINLEYFFSRVDPTGYGCGTKLPHNVAGLIGVMDGHASDLRTGLPWQMVELHEPLRLLLVIDAPEERIRAAVARLPAVRRLVENRWVQVAAWDPQAGGELALFAGTGFVPYVPETARLAEVERSAGWFSGHRGQLPPARVRAALTAGEAA